MTPHRPKVVLLSPPVAKACEPLLGIGILKAWLNKHGYDCDCLDVNILAQEWLLTPEVIDEAVIRLEKQPSQSKRLKRSLSSWPGVRRGFSELKQSLRCPDGYKNANSYRTAVTTLNRTMRLVGAAHDIEEGSPITVSLTDYLDHRVCDMSSESVAGAARRPESNLFYPWFRDSLIPQLRAMNPDIIGLSFIFRNQLLCGAAMAALIRRELPNVHVVLGGELVSAWAPHWEHTSLAHLADSLIPYEGEYGLLGLCQELEKPTEHRDFGNIPNLHWWDYSGEAPVFRRNPTRKPASLLEVPTPDYSFAPWDLYFAPERTAPLVTARGCYWNRCTFCPEVVNPETKLRFAKIAGIARDMDAVHDAHGVTTFHFIDSAMPPKLLRSIAEYIRDKERPYRWYGFSRLESYLFRPGFAETLHAGGCRMLKLGLETASQRLLDHMDKKQDVGDVSRILRALRDAQIMVHGFIMFGTPYEEHHDAELTRRFIAEHHDCVQFLNCSIMNLATGSPMALDPAAHGIQKTVPYVIGEHTLDLALYSNFEATGWGRVGARKYLQDVFLKDTRVRPLHLRTPVHYDSNHSIFFHPLVFPGGQTSQVGSGGSSKISALVSSSSENEENSTVQLPVSPS
jgi:hypothetical protein